MRREIPSIQDVLRWSIVFRIIILSAILIPGILILDDTGSEFLSHRLFFFFILVMVFSLMEYAYSRRKNSVVFQVYAHLFFDLFVISIIVDATGSVGSQFTFLYILLILEAGILLKRIGAIMWATVSSLVYLLLGIVNFWGDGSILTHSGGIAPLSLAPSGRPLFDVFFPLSLFYLVALIIGFISSRLDQAGRQVVDLGRELKRMRLESSDILFHIPTGVLTCDLSGRLVFLNPACQELLRLEGDRLTGHPIAKVFEKRHAELKELIEQTIETREPVSRAEVILRRRSVRERVFLGVSTSLIRDPDGGMLGVTAIFRDITDLKRLETMSAQTLRLKAIAEMSASIAHEIKNPLSTIHSSLEFLERQPSEGERRRILEMARRESERLSGLLDDFLKLARIRVEEWQSIHLRELIEEVKALVMVRSDVASRITIRMSGFGDDGEDVVWGDSELLKQVFLNLFINSAESIEDLGTVTIHLEQPLDEKPDGETEGKSYRRIAIEDDGSGFSDEAVEKAFEPFFTTKADGSGLGLAITQKIVEAHFGRIELEHAENGGARFILSFPVQRPAGVRKRVQPRSMEKGNR